MQSQAYNQHEESAIKKTVMKIIEEASQLKKFKVMIHWSEDKDLSTAIAKSMHDYHHAFIETVYKMIHMRSYRHKDWGTPRLDLQYINWRRDKKSSKTFLKINKILDEEFMEEHNKKSPPFRRLHVSPNWVFLWLENLEILVCYSTPRCIFLVKN